MLDSSTLLAMFTALIAGFLAPAVLLHITGRQARAAKYAEWKQQREEKEEDWKRQDDVAAKAAAVAAAALEVQRVAIERTEAAAKDAAAEARHLNEKLAAVHSLVDGDMTLAREAELREVTDGLQYLKALIARYGDHGDLVSADDREAVHQKEKRIVELNRILAQRRATMLKVTADFGPEADPNYQPPELDGDVQP